MFYRNLRQDKGPVKKDHMNHLQRLASPDHRSLSTLLAFACLALAIALPALTLYGLCTTPVDVWLAKLGIAPASTAGTPGFSIADWQTALAVLVGMLPVCATAYGLLRARSCFLGFVRGEVFSLRTVSHLAGFASGIFVAAISALVVPSLVGLLLTLYAPDGKHALVLNIGSDALLMLLFAGVVWQIARVMAKAVELAEENAQIV